MHLSEKHKKILAIIVAAAVIAAYLVLSILRPAPEHIEDTNGPDNYALQQITEADVVAQKMGTRGGLNTSESHWNYGSLTVSSGVKHSCRKFTGVYMLYSCTIFKGSDIHVTLADFQVYSGNFAFYIVFDGQIVGQVLPDDSGFSEFILENIEKSGTLEYVIAGESADFQFIAPSEW